MMRMLFADNFFYMIYFQEVGPAEAELEADPRDTMTTRSCGEPAEKALRMPTGIVPPRAPGF